MDNTQKNDIIDSAIKYIKKLSMIVIRNTTIEGLNYDKSDLYFDEVENTTIYSRAIIDNLKRIKETKE